MSVPVELLARLSRLTETEDSILKPHVDVGFDILKSAEMPWEVPRSCSNIMSEWAAPAPREAFRALQS